MQTQGAMAQNRTDIQASESKSADSRRNGAKKYRYIDIRNNKRRFKDQRHKTGPVYKRARGTTQIQGTTAQNRTGIQTSETKSADIRRNGVKQDRHTNVNKEQRRIKPQSRKAGGNPGR